MMKEKKYREVEGIREVEVEMRRDESAKRRRGINMVYKSR
jgi:hypothetical protein